ncbi:MAG: hypothetical protein RIC55_22675 [Pirellulaceae bacterium]
MARAAQTEEDAAAADAAEEAPAADDGEMVDTRDTKAVEIGPREIRLHLMDGSILAGDLTIDVLTIETDFGTLKVPIERLRGFRPGLDSYPQVTARFEKLTADLGDDDYATREDAHKQLLAWGLPIRQLLAQVGDGDNAERKRHRTEILAELEELAEDADEFAEESAPPLVRRDTVVTTDFTIVGRIVEKEFNITSKYGDLVVKLADVDNGDRDIGGAEPIHKRIGVDGTFVAQRQFKSSGIRLKAGDKVSIRAEGQIVMSPWGSEAYASPDGGVNYGWYLPSQIPGGALVAKIGSGGKVFKVGSRHAFVARSGGVLQLAVGIDNNYAGDGYSFPGKYDVRVKVEPK